MHNGRLRARAVGIGVGITSVLVASCGLLPDMDGFAGNGVTDAGVAEAGVGDANAVDGGDAGDAGRPALPTCVGGRIGPIAAFDATPAGAQATACGIENVLVADGQVAGLDADQYGGFVDIDTRPEYGCVGVEFASQVKTIYVRVAAEGNACGAACLGDGGCGAGHYADVFASATRDNYKFVPSELVTTTALTDYTMTVPSTTKVVIVCRGGWARDKDDVAVDAITAACTP